MDNGGLKWYKSAFIVMDLNVLMGHAPAKIDEKGRLKVPSGFRKIIEEKYGEDCFITSTDGERALVYPLPVWYDFQSRLEELLPELHDASRVLEDLARLDSREVVEEPAATRVHQLRVSLELEELPDRGAVGVVERTDRVSRKSRRPRRRRRSCSSASITSGRSPRSITRDGSSSRRSSAASQGSRTTWWSSATRIT